MSRLAVVVAVAFSVSCGGGGTGDGGGGTQPPPTPNIGINGGNSQQVAVGTAVPTPPSVRVTNASGAGVANISVTFAVATGGGSATGTTQTTNSSGIATVGGWTMGTALGVNTMTATASGTAGGPLTFTATAIAGPAAKIELSAGNGQSVVLGSPVGVAPVVKVTDVGGNPVAGTTVTFTTGTGGGTVNGATQLTNASGLATVGSWTPGAMGTNTLVATSTGLTGNPITFTATATAGPASKLAITTVPSSTATNRVAFVTQPVVQVQDAGGNSVAQAGTVVTAAITAGGGTLGGTATATTSAAGTATFTGLSISGTTGARTLTFTATGLAATTAQITTIAGAATAIAVDANNNQSAPAGSTLGTPPSVKVTDADANPVPGVAIAFAVTGGGGSATGLSQTTNAAGVAAPGSWTLGAAVGTNTMTATSTPALSGSPVTLTATGVTATGLKLAVTTAPSTSAVNRVAFATQPVIQLRDAGNAAVAQAGVVITVAISAGGGTLGGTATATTNASGAATFTNLSISGTVGARTLTFSTSGYTSITAPVTTSAGAATTIAVDANNNQSATAGAALATPPSVKVTDADANPVSGVTVTFAVATGGGSGTGLTPVTNASGIAAPGSWTLGATPGANTMTATATGLTGSPVTLTATGTASSVSLTSVSPSLLTPGISATITGTGFNTTAASNAVTVDGVAASVTAATATQLTVTIPASMPCEATHDATLSVTVTGNPAQTITKPLQVATQRTLAVGQSVIVTAANEQRCNELSNTGTSRYYVAVSNTSTAYTTGISGTAFQLRGAAGSGGSGLSPAMALAALRVRAPVERTVRRPVIARNTPADEADRSHMRLVDQNREILMRNRGRGTPRSSGATRSIAAPVVGDIVSLNIPNINNTSNICLAPLAMTGRIAYVGTKTIVVEDNTNPLYGQIDTTYAAIANEFDNTMLPLLTTNYGNPLARDAATDNNGRIVMVFSRKVNDNFPNLAGFVVTCDFFARDAGNTQSNLGEYFYATTPTVSGTASNNTNNPPRWRWQMRGTIIHEVKHITSFAERISRNASAYEESWLEETLARVSEELYERQIYSFAQKANIGYGSAASPVGPYCGVRVDPSWTACVGRPRGIVRVFEELAPKWYAQPENYSPLGRIDANDFSFYATGWSLLRWAVDQSTTPEATFLKALTQETSLSGVANLEARTGRTFADMLPEWTMANVLDDYPGWAPSGTASTRMKQLSWDFRNVFAGYKADFTTQVTWTAWPLVPLSQSFGAFTRNATVKPGTSAVFEISGTATAKQLLELKAQTGTAAAPAELRITIVRVQ